MTEFNIQTVEAPAETRANTAEPNPFIPETGNLFPTEEGKALRIELPKGEEGEKVAKRLRYHARNAAQAVDLSARVKIEVEGKGKDEKIIFTAWSRPKITRPRKPAAETAETATE